MTCRPGERVTSARYTGAGHDRVRSTRELNCRQGVPLATGAK